ncbi:lipopolysaccharide biosynthesis protein [Aliagarivorans taiwanensis]|uniref:lipopolysaccharide biosynthesis protein n=1 Tax=Aliagarivorans taiwanensis TaxID=561966 RepID=UPI0004213BA0|nr:hypothetical protein [Aliagarivorans taiwanensis]
MFGRVFKSMLALAGSNALAMILQLVSVPLLLSYWGAPYYGEWLVLFALPSFFMFSDLGLVNVASNDLENHYRRREYKKCKEVFFSTIVFISFVFAFVAVLLALSAKIIASFIDYPFSHISNSEAFYSFLLLYVAVYLNLIINFASSSFRCVGRYHITIIYQTVARFFFTFSLLISAVLGGKAVLSSFLMMFSLLLVAFVLFALIRGSVRHVIPKKTTFSWFYIRSSMVGSIAFMLLPISNAIYLQGSLIVVGALFGSQIVAVFNSLRLLTRCGGQLVSILGRSLWSEVNRLNSNGDLLKVRELLNKVLRVMPFAVLLYFLLGLLCGESVFKLWVGDSLEFDKRLFGFLLIYSAVMAVWQILEVFLLSVNKHTRYSFVFFATTFISVVVSAVCAGLMGVYSFPIWSSVFGGWVCVFLLMEINKVYVVSCQRV